MLMELLKFSCIYRRADENGVAVAVHMAESPVACLAAVHTAAAMHNVLALEFHSVDVPWWADIVTGINNPIFEKESPIPKSAVVTDEYLDRVGEALVGGARLAEKAGFDGVDIKCCHRYLNSELLSAYTRKGRYGGSLENRTRLLRESIKGAKEICSDKFIVSSRLNVYDGFPYPYGFGVAPDGGTEFAPSEPAWLIGELYKAGVRILNITMGITEIIHAFNWEGDSKYPLGSAKEIWREYLGVFGGGTVLLEFMPDGKIESLAGEAAALKKITEVF